MKSIEIHTEFITMAQFLKLAECISSGGQAKHFLLEASVAVNGEPENRRGRKLRPGDVVRVDEYGDFRIETATGGSGH